MVSPIWRQIWTTSAVLLNMTSQGLMMGFMSSLLPALKAADSPIQADIKVEAWIASVVGIASIPGYLLSSIIMAVWGRRIAHALAILPTIVGWLMIYTSTGVPTLLIGRILNGYCAGASTALGAIVIGEYSSPVYRGTFLNLKTAAVSLGGMASHILGHFLTWRQIALFSITPNLAALCITYNWPESPAWLASKKEFEKCRDSFIWLRGQDEQAIKELEELIKSQMNSNKSQLGLRQQAGVFFKKFTRKDFLMPLYIILTGALLLEVTGRHIFPAYALVILAEITGSKTNSFYYTLAIDIIITASATFSSYLVRIAKRRTLLFWSGFASITVLGLACTHLFLASMGVVSKENTWIPLSLIVLYFVLVNIGCTPILLSFVGELLPLEHRGVGCMLSGVMISIFVNITLLVAPFLLISVKVSGTFAVSGTSMAVLLIILYFILPETKDRTLQEIECYFTEGKFKNMRKDEETEMKTLIQKIKIENN